MRIYILFRRMKNSATRKVGVERSSAREEWRERDLALRRQDILVSAAMVFAAQGFQGAQMAEIAGASVKRKGCAPAGRRST